MKIDRFRAFGFLVLLAFLALWVQVAEAATLRWRESKFSYVAQNKNLREFLREFGASQGLTVVVSPEIEGTLNGKFDMTPQSMLDLIAATYGVIWYYDGNVLFLYPSSDADTAVLRTSSSRIEELKSAISRLGIADPKYPITYDTRKDVAIVSGPRRYIELVRQTLQAIDANDAVRTDTAVQVFRLKYAWAADQEVRRSGHVHQVPGMATVLRRLYATEQRSPVKHPAAHEGMTTMQRLRAQGLVGKEAAGGERAGPKDYNALRSALGEYYRAQLEGEGKAEGTMPKVGGGPQFEADSRLNAVIVRDAPDRMSYHRAVIEALDVKPELVEIEARIIEVSSDAFNSLGIDWRLRTGGVDAQFSNAGLPTLSHDAAASPGAPRTVPRGGAQAPDLKGALVTSIAGDSARYLIARVKALTQQGKANILSSPKVTTLDNVEAVIENMQTFFVRVAGNLDVGLFDISAGTSLRVIPLVVQDAGGTQIKLAVRIEDGRMTGATVDQIPTISRSTISSESFVNVGESLLIAGYSSEASTEDYSGVPGLSKIPVLGRVFGHKERHKVRVERLFMLTPRLVKPQ